MSLHARPLLACVWLSLLATPAFAQTSPAAQGPKHAFGGTIRDPAGAPIANAEVARVSGRTVLATVLSGDDGRFNLGDLPAGAITIRIRRIGFEIREMELEVGLGLSHFDVSLKPIVAQELPEVVTTVTDGGRLAEFLEHRARRGSFAKFIDQAEIRRRGPLYASELFRTTPGISVRASSVTGNTIRIRGCQPTLWVDGQRMPATELDEVASPSDIGGIAFYPSLNGVPPQYLDRMNRACGVIIVWTRAD